MGYKKKADGVRWDRETRRFVEHRGYSTSIYWNRQMLDDIRALYPTTKNDELAGMLGVSKSTLNRKARELGLKKDDGWLHGMWDDHRKMAHMMSKAMGYPGGFEKGKRANPDGEFKKSHRLTDEQRQKQRASLKRWHQSHRSDAVERGKRAWETRRVNGTDVVSDETRRRMSESQKRWNRENPGAASVRIKRAWERRRS